MHHPTTSSKPMRLAVCGTLLLLAAAKCKDVPGPCDQPGRQTIVFYDQSASAVADAATLAMFRDSVAVLLNSALQCRGDAVHGFLVHGNTRGKVGRVDVVNSVAPPDTLNIPTVRRARLTTLHKRQMDSIRAEGETRLAGLMTANVSPRFKRHTDLLGTLEVVSDVVGQAPPGSTVHVYYLGDMHESMAAPRRDFDARPPASRAEAHAWADADAALLDGMNVDRDRLDGVEVRVLLGNLAEKPGAQEVRSYWERLFANLKIERVRYN